MIRSGAINWGSPINRSCGLNAGLVSWWLARGPWIGGGTWFDLCRRNNGTLTNSPSWAASNRLASAYSIRFDGTNDRYVGLANSAVGATGTLTQWVRTNGNGYAVIVARGGWDNVGGLTVLFDSGNTKITVWLNALGTLIPSTNAIGTGVWAHFAVTWDGVNVRTFVNGVPDTTTANAFSQSYSSLHSFGFWTNRPGQYRLNGDVDDLREYNRALSPGDIAQLYADSLAGYPQTLNRLQRRVGYVAAAAASGKPWHYYQQMQRQCA